MKAALLRLARARWAAAWIGWMFAHMSFALPLQRLRERETLLAFYHPSPAYPVHILIVPKRACASLMELQARDAAFLGELLEVVQELVRELKLEEGGYRLIVNGGDFQEVKQLHFHLVGDQRTGSRE